MRFLGHILVSLLVTALSSAIVALILSHTIGDAPFLQSAATKTGFYDQLATAIPTAVAAGSPMPDQTKTALSGTLTAAYIQQQVETILPALIKHYSQGGPAPLIDLSDLATRLDTSGYPISPELSTSLATPQTVTAGPADSQLSSLIGQSRMLQWAAPLACLVLIALIMVVMRRERWSALARSAIWTAVTLALTAGLFWFVPNLLRSTLDGSPVLKPLGPAIVAFARYICGAITRELLLATAALAVAGGALWSIHGVAKIKARFTKPPKSPKSTPPTSPLPNQPTPTV